MFLPFGAALFNALCVVAGLGAVAVGAAPILRHPVAGGGAPVVPLLVSGAFAAGFRLKAPGEVAPMAPGAGQGGGELDGH